jgi:PKD repeat protein
MPRMITAVFRRSGVLRRGATRLAVPVVLSFVVLLAIEAPQSVAASPSAPPSPQLQAKLTVSDSSPREFHGVLFNASSSSGPIVTYVFNYGDGIVESTNQPLMMHGYQNIGTYNATVVVLDAQGHSATSAAVSVNVLDGTPPVVRINAPRPNQKVRIGKNGLEFRGLAQDPDSGVKRVQLAVQLVHSSQHFKTGGGCIWYDGKVWLVISTCASPRWFQARLSGDHWSFRMSPASRIPAGTYVIRVRAVDPAGNTSSFYVVRLRTILPFRLVR